MNHVIRAIESKAKDNHYMSEPDDAIYEQMERIAAKALVFKEDVQDVGIEPRPEVGQVLWYVDKDGAMHEQELGVDEQDMIFNMQRWGEHLVEFQNVEQFQATLEKLQKRATTKPEAEQGPYIQREMVRVYSKFGFTPEQIQNLILLSEHEDIPEFDPEGRPQETQRLRVMKEVWDEYLTDGEKSQYVKFAAAMAGMGALQGMAPSYLGRTFESGDIPTASIFALGFLGMQVGSSLGNKILKIEFNKFINDLTERDEGLNERLSQDLVFQPGERMSQKEDRGRILTAVGRSQSAFRDILYSVARSYVPAAAMTSVGVVAMTAMDWKLGIAAMATAPISVLLMRRLDKKIRPLHKEKQEVEGELAQELTEQLEAHEDIVLAGMREEMSERVRDISKEQNSIDQDRLAAEAGFGFQIEGLVNSSIVTALTFGGVAMRALGWSGSGDIVASLMYHGKFSQGFREFLYENNHLLKSVEAIIEMEEVFNGYARQEITEDKDRVGASDLEDFSIQVSGMSLEIDGEKIIEDVSFQVPAGGVVRLEGRSGHGKTTLARLISGYYEPTEGDVKVGGHDLGDVKRTGPDSFYKHVAYLSQHPYIFDSGNLRENLEFGTPDASDEDMIQVLRELGLEERFTTDGIIDLASSIRGLSGGEKARLGLARVLLKIRSQENGGIIFLDQATEELDEETEAEVAQILLNEKRQRPDTTFVIISHRSDFIRLLEDPQDGEDGLEIQRVKLDRGKLEPENLVS